MKTKLAATCFLIGALLVPFASFAADSDKDRTSPKDFVKDSVITTKIKAKLAEEKLSSAVHIKVDTDSKGVVHLSGTAKDQAEADKAGSIAKGVDGVASVENNIRIAGTRGSMRAAKASGEHRVAMHGAKASNEERAEVRIKDMHARLQITAAQEEQWFKVAQVMRDNAKQMDTLTKTRAEQAEMNAIDDLQSYGEIAGAHAEHLKKFTPVFKTLYESMSDAQKANADVVFRHGDRKAPHGSMRSKNEKERSK